jgi:hypothetical protein
MLGVESVLFTHYKDEKGDIRKESFNPGPDILALWTPHNRFPQLRRHALVSMGIQMGVPLASFPNARCHAIFPALKTRFFCAVNGVTVP